MSRTTPDTQPPLAPRTGPRAGRKARRLSVVAAIALVAFIAGGLGLRMRSGATTEAADLAGPADRGGTQGGALGAAISRTQALLVADPANAANWAALGADYIAQARITVDPAYYPKAQGALERSLSLSPKDNLPALVGMGALANARHDFAGAANWGLRAQAVSNYNPDVYSVLTDAWTQLGRPEAATGAVQRMLDLSPTLPALARGSYDLEQRGRTAQAKALLQRALADAYVPSDIGFCRYYLGELAFHNGDLDEASSQYQRGLLSDPTNPSLLQGQGKVAALRGDESTAVRDYDTLVQRVPNPQYLIEYGELLTKLGRTTAAAAQFDLIEVEHRLFTANGGQDDLTLAEYQADHGSAQEAVKYAQAEWSRRHMVIVADTLGWALHKAGRDTEALHYADLALSHAWRNALFLHHRSEIEHSLGRAGAAAVDAADAQAVDPHFDPRLPAFSRPT